jgi:hypothetical protein
MRRIIHKLTIAEVSAVDKPSQKPALMTIMKRDDNGDDEMSEKITKADAQLLWDAARDSYIKRHNLSFSKGAAEFATTTEASLLYNKYLAATPGPPIAKAAPPISKAQQVAALEDVTFETLAAERFSGDTLPNAIAKFMSLPEGKKAYEEYLTEKARAGIR